MQHPELVFVIPTYRLRDVSETVSAYDENFTRNGHSVKFMIFDDSTLANHEKYFPLLEQTSTTNEIYYVGPHEKEEFVNFLRRQLRDPQLDALVKNLFRPSYGGNRNFTLIYTLGSLMVSADDDMRPDAIIEDSPECLEANEISRGKLIRPGDNGHTRKCYDLLTSYQEVLGKRVADVPSNFARGDFLVDSAMDLETNASKGYFRENALTLQPGNIPSNAIVKVAQTFRTGTDDVDALDFARLFLANDHQRAADDLNDLYMLVNFRPALTNKNWRIDCGVAGYDNRLGLPPFFPTRLRFEDYIYRLWIQQKGVVAAHVDAAQRHIKNNYMRNPLAAEVFNEEIANLLKRKIKGSLRKLSELTISFDYEGEVTYDDTEEIPSRIRVIHSETIRAAAQPKILRAKPRWKPSAPISPRPSTVSKATSSSRTSPASSTTSSRKSKRRSSSGRAWSRSVISTKTAASSRNSACATNAQVQCAVPGPRWLQLKMNGIAHPSGAHR